MVDKKQEENPHWSIASIIIKKSQELCWLFMFLFGVNAALYFNALGAETLESGSGMKVVRQTDRLAV